MNTGARVPADTPIEREADLDQMNAWWAELLTFMARTAAAEVPPPSPSVDSQAGSDDEPEVEETYEERVMRLVRSRVVEQTEGAYMGARTGQQNLGSINKFKSIMGLAGALESHTRALHTCAPLPLE